MAPTHIRPSKVIIYETAKREQVREDNNDDDDVYEDEFHEEDSKTFDREIVGSVASPYLKSYVYRTQFLDTQCGIHKDVDIIKIGDSPVLVDQDGDITIKEKEFRGPERLWELLTLNRLNKEHVTSDVLWKCKKTLLLTNTHLEGYQPGVVINVIRGKISSKLSPRFSRGPKAGVSNLGYAVHGKNTKMSARALY